MKKILTILFCLSMAIVCNAQSWHKIIQYDDMTNEPSYTYYYGYGDFANDRNVSIIAFFKEDIGLVMVTKCPSAKNFDIAWEAYLHNGGEVCPMKQKEIEVSYNGKVATTNCILHYPTINEVNEDVKCWCVIPNISADNLKEWSFVCVKYYNSVWNENVTQRISLNGFTKAYNGKADNNKR